MTLIYSCENQNRNFQHNAKIENDSIDKSDIKIDNITASDTILIDCDSIFKNKGYQIQLITFNPLNILDFKKNNAVFNLINETEIIYSDSIFTRVSQIEFQDFDKDGIKDILIQNISDVRSNWTYNLYLADLQNNKIEKIKEFNEIKNPKLNNELNIIESYVISGTNYTEFYKLEPNYTVRKYDILIYDQPDENENDIEYNKALEMIKKTPHNTSYK